MVRTNVVSIIVMLYKKSQNVTEGKGPSRNYLLYRVLALREQHNMHNAV